MAESYEPQTFEPRWAHKWEAESVYAVPDDPGDKPKRFVMEMFPYPSGDLHMGHVENYTIADAMARYWRMRGYSVMHPMGYDAFGLPAENAAIKRGIHPQEWTLANIDKMRSSFLRLGYSYDWNREVISCLPDYYKWNQWIFLEMFRRGLAYRKTSPVNWCPVDKTVLAKEQISTGVCWRCGSVPEVRDLTQWFLRITDYSDRLLDDMDQLDWAESLLTMQRNWIGRSQGAEVVFKVKVDGSEATADFPVFTTRPDTLWGATFFVLAAEHPAAAEMVAGTSQEAEYKTFVDEIRRQTEIDRLGSKGAGRGMRMPAVAINPVNGEQIPVWAADYVLMGYGTGAIMAVPAHDQRDFSFARKHAIPIRVVVQPEGQPPLDQGEMTEAAPGTGVLVNSGPFTGTRVDPQTQEGILDVIAWLDEQGKGRRQINYRQRDWLVSRQRYWGTPIPIVHCPQCGEVPVPDTDLPVLLPAQADYTPTDDAVSPLANNPDFVDVDCPECGGPARRETDTLDTFFDSSWYFLRYCDPKNPDAAFEPRKVAGWGPVDNYFGGVEHAVMHLIYARFFTKFFKDIGLLDFDEPFLRLFNQGHVSWDGKEMSKSTGHVIEASATVNAYGADSARTFILFSSPPAADYDFPADGYGEIGRVAHSWLSRVWRILQEPSPEPVPEALNRQVHRSVKAVTEDMEEFGLNTAIARMMELVNAFSKHGGPVPREAAEKFLRLLAPIAPFLTEELWHRYGNQGSIHQEPWPEYDAELAAVEKVTMVVQVNGKVRDRIDVPAEIAEEEMRSLALSSERVKEYLNGKQPVKVISVPPKLVNVVVR
ncbi:MAG TPA: leucine--tRNA ligase [Actinomycetota bacterium]|nr:leucine--tRNA ligase [Actinomycetota bacterium]